MTVVLVVTSVTSVMTCTTSAPSYTLIHCCPRFARAQTTDDDVTCLMFDDDAVTQLLSQPIVTLSIQTKVLSFPESYPDPSSRFINTSCTSSISLLSSWNSANRTIWCLLSQLTWLPKGVSGLLVVIWRAISGQAFWLDVAVVYKQVSCF